MVICQGPFQYLFQTSTFIRYHPVSRKQGHMQRREFITLLGGASAWPLAARAQQADRMRRIGVLISYAEDDPETKVRLAAFRQGLEKRGWSEGHNVQIEPRFAAGGSA